jgi:hypothetical protein
MRFATIVFFASPVAVTGSLPFVSGTKLRLMGSEEFVVEQDQWSQWLEPTDDIKPELNAVGGSERNGHSAPDGSGSHSIVCRSRTGAEFARLVIPGAPTEDWKAGFGRSKAEDLRLCAGILREYKSDLVDAPKARLRATGTGFSEFPNVGFIEVGREKISLGSGLEEGCIRFTLISKIEIRPNEAMELAGDLPTQFSPDPPCIVRSEASA